MEEQPVEEQKLEFSDGDRKVTLEYLRNVLQEKHNSDPDAEWVVVHDRKDKLLSITSKNDPGLRETLLTIPISPEELQGMKPFEVVPNGDDIAIVVDDDGGAPPEHVEYTIMYVEQLLRDIEEDELFEKLNNEEEETPFCPCGETVELSMSQSELVDFTIVDQSFEPWGADAREVEKVFELANFKPVNGDIILFGDYKPGECERVLKEPRVSGIKQKSEDRLKIDKSDLGPFSNDLKVTKQADHIRVQDSWQDRFVYPHGQFTSISEQRQNYSMYLKEQGILSLIADFIADVEEVDIEQLPPAENLLEHFLLYGGYTEILHQQQQRVERLENEAAEKEEMRSRIEVLVAERDELKKRLDKYEFLYPTYENRNPNPYLSLQAAEPYADLKGRFWTGIDIPTTTVDTAESEANIPPVPPNSHAQSPRDIPTESEESKTSKSKKSEKDKKSKKGNKSPATEPEEADNKKNKSKKSKKDKKPLGDSEVAQTKSSKKSKKEKKSKPSKSTKKSKKDK